MDTKQKNPMEIFEKQAKILDQIYQEQQSIRNNLLLFQKRRFSLSDHAGSGAIISCMIGSIWVLQYLFSTMITTYFPPSIIWEYVSGQDYNLGSMSEEALFIVVTRFLLAFSISWAPITFLIALIRKFF